MPPVTQRAGQSQAPLKPRDCLTPTEVQKIMAYIDKNELLEGVMKADSGGIARVVNLETHDHYCGLVARSYARDFDGHRFSSGYVLYGVDGRYRNVPKELMDQVAPSPETWTDWQNRTIITLALTFFVVNQV